MGRLNRHICYLSGPMDEAKDGGIGWRASLKPKLWGMGIGVIDPCDKPCIGYDEDETLHAYIKELRDKKEFGKIVEVAKPIVGNDLRSQHISNFTILYIDKDTFMFGTTVEFSWAIQQRKPVLIVCKQGVQNIPLFAFGMSPPEMMFNNFDEMMAYIKYVDEGTKIDEKRRWYFFDYAKIFGEK